MYAHFGHPYTRSLGTPSLRWLALFLAMVMVVSSLPFAATLNQQNIPFPTLPGQPITVPTAQEAGMPTLDIPALQNMPVSFVANAGQSDGAVQFQAHTMGGVVYFTTNEVVLTLPTQPSLLATNTDDMVATAVRMQFHGSSAAVAVSGMDKQRGVSNYLYGSTPAQWITNVANYSGITYDSLYPGIALRYDGNAGTLKSTYTVAPGANPALIQWSYAGTTGVSIDKATGNLHIGLAGTATPLVEQAPIAWQVIDGNQVPVAVNYALHNGTVGFALGSYNPAHALIIDPTITYATYVGGTSGDLAHGLAVDEKDGFVYVTGRTDSSNFATVNPLSNNFGVYKSSTDIFIRKIDVRSNEMVYSTYMGGNKTDIANAIALGKAGNVYITGFTQSPMYDDEFKQLSTSNPETVFVNSFPISPTTVVTADGTVKVDPTKSAYSYMLDRKADGTASGSGLGDAFVAKLTPDGGGLVYSTYLGGSARDEGLDIAVHTSKGDFYMENDLEYAYVTGLTQSSDFPTYKALPNSTFAGGQAAFMTRVGPHGQSLQYSTYIGGNGSDTGKSIAVTSTSAENSDPIIYVVGETKSTNIFSATAGFTTALKTQPIVGNQLNGGNNTNNTDGFLTRVIYASGQLSYTLSSYLGGTSDDSATGIAVDDAGDIYISGYTASAQFSGVTDTSFRKTNNGNTDAFVSKLNKAGTISFSSFLGGTQEDSAYGIALDEDGNIYVAGSTSSNGSDTDPGQFPTKELTPQQDKNNGSGDAFITKFNKDGASLSYSIFVGGNGKDVANDIVVHGSGDQSFAFIAGETNSNEFPVTDKNNTYSGGDGFIAKVGPPRLYFAGYDTDIVNPTLATRQPMPVSEGSGTVAVIPELTQASSTKFDINVKTRECGEGAHAAKEGVDFQSVDKNVFIDAGTTSISGTTAISVTIMDDGIDQPDRHYFCLDIGSGFGETQSLTITIGDNDGPNVKFAQQRTSTNEPGATATVQDITLLDVTLSAASPEDIIVPISAVAGSDTVKEKTDYALNTQELTIPAGATTAQVELEIPGDNIKEHPEDVLVVLGEPLPNQDALFTEFNKKPETTLHRAFIDKTVAQTATVSINDSPNTPKSAIGFAGTAPISYIIPIADVETALGYSLKQITQTVTAKVDIVEVEVKTSAGQTAPTLFGSDIQVKLVPTGQGVTVADSYTLPAELAQAQTLPITITLDPKDRPSKSITLGLEVVGSGTDLAEVTAGNERTALLITPAVPLQIFLPMVRK